MYIYFVTFLFVAVSLLAAGQVAVMLIHSSCMTGLECINTSPSPLANNETSGNSNKVNTFPPKMYLSKKQVRSTSVKQITKHVLK